MINIINASNDNNNNNVSFDLSNYLLILIFFTTWDTFFHKFNIFSWLPLNQWQMMSTWLPLKEIFINLINELLRGHFHFYITNKGRNEMAHNINSLDTSDGRVKVTNLKVKGSIRDRIFFLIIENFELLEKEFYPRRGLNPWPWGL